MQCGLEALILDVCSLHLVKKNHALPPVFIGRKHGKVVFSWTGGQIQFTVASLHLTLARGERA